MNDIPEDVMQTAKEADARVFRGEAGVFDVVAAAIMAERERCARISESYPFGVVENALGRVAAHIRRGNHGVNPPAASAEAAP